MGHSAENANALVRSFPRSFRRICNFVRSVVGDLDNQTRLPSVRRGEGGGGRPSRDLVFCFLAIADDEHKRRNGIVTRGNASVATSESLSSGGR